MAYYDNHDHEPVIAFGHLARAWFDQNCWPQYITEAWSKANGHYGPHASQMSKLMNGILEPKPFFWVELHRFNLAVAEDRPGPCDTRFSQLIIGGDALRRADGTPLTIGDFYELFVGVQKPNLLNLLVKHRKSLAEAN